MPSHLATDSVTQFGNNFLSILCTNLAKETHESNYVTPTYYRTGKTRQKDGQNSPSPSRRYP